MKKHGLFLFFVLLILLLIITGCSDVNKLNPSDATISYLEGLAEKDKVKVISFSCKTWEEQASLEVDALLSVDAALNNVQCKDVGSDGSLRLVSCTGLLDLTYGDEIRSIDLSPRVYSMALEDGQWRVCSYK